ncbi:Uncharacterised protein [Candidatus Gugararchaeum adminiculabundum]|nr:Uncharacterised protein [Candidatus Gugararchaeum adminiculabundum]
MQPMFGGAVTFRSFQEMEVLVGMYSDAGGEIIMAKPKMHELDANRIEDTVGRFLEVCGKFNMPVFFHPQEARSEKGYREWLVANDKKDMELIVESYARLMQALKGKKGTYPLFITHGGRLHVNGRQINGKDMETLEEAISGTKQYLEKLYIAKMNIFGNEEFIILLENMPAPGRNKGEEPVPYSVEQIAEVIAFLNGNVEACLDVGHLQMTEEEVMRYILAGVPIRCTHLHGNDTTDDQHFLPYGELMKRVEGLGKFLLDDKMVHILEIRRSVLRNTHPLELKRVITSLKNGRLPSLQKAII